MSHFVCVCVRVCVGVCVCAHFRCSCGIEVIPVKAVLGRL